MWTVDAWMGDELITCVRCKIGTKIFLWIETTSLAKVVVWSETCEGCGLE